MQAYQRLWLAAIHDAYGSSLALDMSFSLTLRPPLTLAVAETSLRSSPRPIGRSSICHGSFRHNRYQLRRCR